MLKMIMESPDERPGSSNCRLLQPEPDCEILNGEPVFIPAQGTKHQRIASKLTAVLFDELENENHGIVLASPCNVMLSPWDIVRPDILFISRNRIGIIGKRIILGPPDLAVEILSEESRERDTREKRKIYAESEIPEYWIVDPDMETIEPLVWSELGYVSAGLCRRQSLLSTPMLPGPGVNLSRIFG